MRHPSAGHLGLAPPVVEHVGREPEGGARGLDRLLGPADPLRHRGLGHEERARDLVGGEAAQEPQRPAVAELRMTMPVNLRAAEEPMALGNKFGLIFVDLPTPDPQAAHEFYEQLFGPCPYRSLGIVIAEASILKMGRKLVALECRDHRHGLGVIAASDLDPVADALQRALQGLHFRIVIAQHEDAAAGRADLALVAEDAPGAAGDRPQLAGRGTRASGAAGAEGGDLPARWLAAAG